MELLGMHLEEEGAKRLIELSGLLSQPNERDER